MHWYSQATAGKVLPQGQENGFTVAFGEPMVFAKRYVQGIFKNTGDASVSLQPQSAASEAGAYSDIGSPTTIVAKAESMISFAIPAGATHWRIEGTGASNGIVEWVEAEASHANIGLP